MTDLEALAVHTRDYSRSSGMIDCCDCSCGWRGETYFDGMPWAEEDWERHVAAIRAKANQETNDE